MSSNPLLYVDPLGLARQFQFGISGTIQFGFPQLLLLGAGFSGGTTVGISIPDDWKNWRCYQFFANGQGNVLVGIGIYVGVGGSVGSSTSDGPLPSGFSSNTGIYLEGNAGWGKSGGVSASGAPGTSALSWEDWLGPIDTLNLTPDPRLGAGYGGNVAVGQYLNSGYTTPTLGDLFDSGGNCECN